MSSEPTAISYEDFVDRVRRFQRTSVLIACTRVGWRVWTQGERSGLNAGDVHLVRAHIGFVAAIAAATCNEHRDKHASEADAIRFCHEFLGVEERVLGAGRSSSQELVALLRASPIFSSYSVTETAVGEAVLHLALGPLLRSQWQSRMAAYEGVPRAWELLRRVYRCRNDLVARHTAALQIEPLSYFQAGFSLFALLQAQRMPGFHDVGATWFEGGIDRVLNLDVPALELVASRLASTRDDLVRWHEGVRRLDRLDRKYAPSPLVATPMIRLDRSFPGAKGNGREVICPSPDHFVWALQTSAVAALLDCGRPGENLTSLLGDVLSEYIGDVLRHTCGKDAVIAVDDLPIQGKKADFVVRDGDRALVIEIKRSVWGAQQRTVGRARDVVSMWERLYEPCEQCSNTITALRQMDDFKTVNTYLPVACVDDVLLLQGRAFVSVCRAIGVLDRLALPGLEILSVLELEKGLVTMGPSRLIDLILEKQASSSRDGLLGLYAAQHAAPVTGEHSDWSFLDEAERDLTPPDPKSR